MKYPEITQSMRSRDDLHDYQVRAVDFIKSTPNCALWVDMGLGKTVSTLTAVSDLFDGFEVARVLVIAPLRVALKTWPDEIKAWAHVRHLTSRVITGSPAQRKAIVDSDRSQVHIINREMVAWLVGYLQAQGAGWPYDMVVIDESSSFKSHQSKRWKFLRKALPAIDRLVELTGTPAPNGLLDVWPQIFLLDRGERLGRTYTGFRSKYFISDYMGYNFTIREGADDKIHEKLADVCLTMSAEDYIELPDRVDRIVDVDLPVKAREQYAELEREFIAEFDGDEVTVLSAAALANKLLQFANGAVYVDGGGYAEVHGAKLDALEDLIEGANGSPVLIAYSYRTDLDRIQSRIVCEVLGKDPEQIDRWNAGEIPVLLAHPASAGHGLNLQDGGHTVVWFGLCWSLELYQQFNARLHRQGQGHPVVVHHVVTRGTVDETVLDALGRKDVTQRALLDALKHDIGGRT